MGIYKKYVRTLKSYPERTEWIKKEMERVGISNYELYYNIDKDDAILDKWKDEGRIKLGPECFQCKKLKCCCRAKVLTRGMVANFISCYLLWKEIIEDGQDDSTLYLIMEDDVLFQDNVGDVLDILFKKEASKAFPQEPLLFKLGWGDMLDYRQTHFEVKVGEHVWLQNSNKFANPCYVANKYFFKYLVDNFEQITSACDVWVHRTMGMKITNYEIHPALCKELSHIGEIRSAMHTKYSEASKYIKLFNTTKDPGNIDKFIEAEKKYFDYWFSYGKNEWGIEW